MTAASAYTPTDSGWGLWFLVAVVVLATVAVGVAWIARRIAAVIAEHRRPRHPLAPPRPLLILLRDAVPHAVPHSPQGVTNGTEEADRG